MVLRNVINIFVLIVALPFGSANADIVIPDCPKLLDWSKQAWAAHPKNIYTREYTEKRGRKGTYLLDGFRDEMMQPVFGATFDSWAEKDFTALEQAVTKCYFQLIEQRQNADNQYLWTRPKDPKLKQIAKSLSDELNSFSKFFVSTLRISTNGIRPQEFKELAAYQQEVYSLRKQAYALREKHEELLALKPSQEGLEQIFAMQTEPLIAYLDPSERNKHQTKLKNVLVSSMDQILIEVVEEMKGLPTDISGMTALINLFAETKNSFAQYQSTKWQFFDGTYKTILDNAAQKALPSFVEQLKQVPASDEAISEVSGSLNGVFPYRPLPSNFSSYEAAVTERQNQIRKELAIAKCNASLDSYNINEDRTLPLLGPKGEMTLGEFICGINQRRYTFKDWKTEGWFTTRYVLGLTNHRNVSVEIVFENLKAIEDKKMLVGTKWQDASETQEFTLSEWQRQAEKMLVSQQHPLDIF